MNDPRVPALPLFARSTAIATAAVRSGVRAGEANTKANERLSKLGG